MLITSQKRGRAGLSGAKAQRKRAYNATPLIAAAAPRSPYRALDATGLAAAAAGVRRGQFHLVGLQRRRAEASPIGEEGQPVAQLRAATRLSAQDR
jgi:hypothetical protein